MYATLYHAIKDIFGLEIPLLQWVMMFGFFVALAFLAAHWAMSSELKRKEKEGLIKPFSVPVVPPNPIVEYVTSALIGFVTGWKVLYILFNSGSIEESPQDFILSLDGSIWLGLLVSAAFVAYKYFELKRTPEIEPGTTRLFHPYEMMGTLTIIAAVSGFAGAKLFHHLEHFADLVKDPMVLIRDPFSGLTFYGGLIGGAIGVLWYAKKHNVGWKIMLDVGGPAMMLAYGVGRMGCHMSGDGDWGVANLTPKPDWLSWLPDWAWAYGYEGSVLGPKYVPEVPVWPTPLYEVVMALAIFGVLWYLRKRISVPGVLFSIYLIFSGLERGLIETIRVNPRDFNLFGKMFTQAEVISASFVLLGIAGVIYFLKSHKKKPLPTEVTST